MIGVDKVYLVAEAVSDPQLETNAIDAAKKAGVRHVVKLSVAGADAPFGCVLEVARRVGGPVAPVRNRVDHAAPVSLHEQRFQLVRHIESSIAERPHASVRVCKLASGERLPLVVGSDSLPMLQPNRWMLFSQRPRVQANTLIAQLQVVAAVYD